MVITRGKSSGGATKRNRRLLAMVTILIVAILVTVSTRYILPVQDQPEPSADLPERLDGETVQVFNTTTWRGVTGPLRRPVSIEGGGRLELVDCNITVLLEDLVLYGCPFWVRAAGTLVLRNSTVRVVQNPKLATAAYFSNYDGSGVHIQGSPPWMARVVNLVDTERPVLSFDVSWRRQRTDLLVLVQRTAADPLEEVARFGRAGEGYGEWVHCKVDLSTLRGGVCRVVITPWNNDLGAILVSNLTVQEAGGGRLWDSFPTGLLFEDGWTNHFMVPFMDATWRDALWAPLVRSYGDLEVHGSTLAAPAGLPRYLSWDNVDAGPEEYVQELNYLMASKGADLEVMGDLTILDSRVLNVPINLIDSVVAIERCVIEGDAHLMTMTRSPGSIEDTRFVSRERAVPGWLFDDEDTFEGQYLWGLSVADTFGVSPLLIARCAFEGGEVGLELRFAVARLEDCTFRGVAKCAIWERDPFTPLGDWEDIDASNEFLACEGYQYLRTGLCRLEQMAGLDYMTVGWILTSTLTDLSILRMVYLDSVYTDMPSYLHLPTVTVDATGAVQRHTSVRLVLSSDAKREFASIDIDTSSRTVEMGWVEPRSYVPREMMPLLYPDIGPATVRVQGPAGPGVLNISVEITLNALGLALEDPGSLLLAMDGEPPQRLALTGNVSEEDSLCIHKALVRRNLTVSPGSHKVSLSVWNTVLDGELEVWNGSFDVYRVDDGITSDELAGMVCRGEGIVLIDPGVSLDMINIVVEHAGASVLSPSLAFVLGDGSSIRLSGEGSRSSGLDLLMRGNGTFSLEDIECSNLRLEVYNASGHLEDIRCGSLGFTGVGSNVTALRMSVFGDVDYVYCEMSSLAIEGSSLSFTSPGSWTIVLLWGGLTLKDTSLVGTGQNLPLVVSEGSTVLLDSASFSALSPEIFSEWYGWESWPGQYDLEMSGCSFRNGSYLILPGNLSTQPGDGYILVPALSLSAWGNRFFGPGSGVLGDARFMPALIEGSTFTGGARAYACYGIDVVLTGSPRWGEYHWTIVGGEARERSPQPSLGGALEELYGQYNAVGLWPTSSEMSTDRCAVAIVHASDEYFNVPLVWFQNLPVDVGRAEITVPRWPDVDDMLVNFRDGRIFWDGDPG